MAGNGFAHSMAAGDQSEAMIALFGNITSILMEVILFP
uniref:Uncharacterized protein n=2 Tax=Oryza sativa subsp. japonica TaxID=39947 RepID=Q7G7E0_ORYSJ|nr:hypothetical protein OJ1004_F02.18 [Oryza sativa Japonica Group]AAM18151.1 Hypothetical protein [Oryza sativa Japonica Group]AAP52745.1 hypothetical protein LOC_Os10g14004 [Oryza sativa Japonica Group]